MGRCCSSGDYWRLTYGLTDDVHEHDGDVAVAVGEAADVRRGRGGLPRGVQHHVLQDMLGKHLHEAIDINIGSVCLIWLGAGAGMP